MVPVIEDKLYHFGPRGLYNGLVLLGDDETHSYWDHITGECVYGAMKGKRMDVFSIEHMKAKNALTKYPDLNIALSQSPLIMKMMAPMMKIQAKTGFLPPFFRKTMKEVDPRLPEMASGLGVMTDSMQRFYPVDAIKEAGGQIEEILDGIKLKVFIDENDHVPYALDEQGKKPMQLFTRWYGFSLTYPNCEVYKAVL